MHAWNKAADTGPASSLSCKGIMGWKGRVFVFFFRSFFVIDTQPGSVSQQALQGLKEVVYDGPRAELAAKPLLEDVFRPDPNNLIK